MADQGSVENLDSGDMKKVILLTKIKESFISHRHTIT